MLTEGRKNTVSGQITKQVSFLATLESIAKTKILSFISYSIMINLRSDRTLRTMISK